MFKWAFRCTTMFYTVCIPIVFRTTSIQFALCTTTEQSLSEQHKSRPRCIFATTTIQRCPTPPCTCRSVTASLHQHTPLVLPICFLVHLLLLLVTAERCTPPVRSSPWLSCAVRRWMCSVSSSAGATSSPGPSPSGRRPYSTTEERGLSTHYPLSYRPRTCLLLPGSRRSELLLLLTTRCLRGVLFSVTGLSLDFLVYNVTGFTFYTVYAITSQRVLTSIPPRVRCHGCSCRHRSVRCADVGRAVGCCVCCFVQSTFETSRRA